MIPILIVIVGAALAQKPVRPPQVEKITESVYRIGHAVVDTRARTVTCPGEINMHEGSVEYLAVTADGKTYESVLKLDVRPIHLQVALLMLGLEPRNNLHRQGDRTTPAGPPLELRVRWRDRAGTEHDVRAETLMDQVPGGRTMPNHLWAYTGSRILREGYEAELSGSIIAVWHDPAAMVDNPLPAGADNAYVVDSNRTPKLGTPIQLIFHAPAPREKLGKRNE